MIPSSTASPGGFRIRARDAGPTWPPSTRACPCPSCRLPCSSASARGATPISPTRSCRPCATGSAATWRRRMSERSDALVFFGATGDLAYKQIFPALCALVNKRKLEIPIIGVAKQGWNLDQLKQRAHDSLAAAGLDDEA